MARQERAVRTRRTVLEAAAAVFDERGYKAATIADILKRADVTKGALYFHFASKRALAQGILDEQFSQAEVPPREYRMQELIDTGMLLAHRMRHDPLLSAGARLSLGPDMKEIFDGGSLPGWIQVTEQLLTQAKQQDELLSHINPPATAWTLSACWTGAQIYSQTLSNREDLEHRIADLYQHILPTVVTPTVLARLDLTPTRGAHVHTEITTTNTAQHQR
ncbi:ScbR family autoregulator-binding transcription factor [Streptomyces sp. NPDC058877]|uniref:ScbR family autoregulator-binding transcription factor n=1 Tax=unclassified Streptomyces TaxID=2593676 RepID=UPI0036B18FE2